MSERTIRTVAKRNIPELLAPVGGRAQLEAAINNGADAVYMGGPLFNARMKAGNFGSGEIKDAIAFAHENGAKVYITLNTLIKDEEMKKAFSYACNLYEAGADAVILQDLGLARLIRRYLPDFSMHMSTQGTVYNISGLEMAAELGFTRVVPARELSLEEIGQLCRHRPGNTEIEVFVHGALCMCYSGQCQMSRLLGGGSARSGNRGLCAQPCRLIYKDDRGNTGYALSPRDMCVLEDMPMLCSAGVNSLKIEGRLKSPEYVAVVTGIYRKYLDMYEAGQCTSRDGRRMEIDTQDLHRLLQIFSRGEFTKGYLHGNPGKQILSGSSPKNRGIHVGRVTAVHNAKATGSREGRCLADIKLTNSSITGMKESISLGDGIEMAETGNVVTYLKQMNRDTVRVGDFKTSNPAALMGAEVFKVTDAGLNSEALSASGREKTALHMEFNAEVGKTPELTVSGDGKTFTISGKETIEKAIRKPADPERIKEQLSKLGGTPFRTSEVRIAVDAEAMVPVSEINEMRRKAVSLIMESRKDMGREPVSQSIISRAEREIDEGFHTKCSNEDFMLIPLELFMTGEYSASMPPGKTPLPYLLNITKGNGDRYVQDNFDSIVQAAENTGIVLGNLGWIKEFSAAGLKIYGDYGLNVFNRQGEKLFDEIGVEVLFRSDEESRNGKHVPVSQSINGKSTSVSQGRAKGTRRLPEEMENVPLMITEYPLNTEYLTDRKGVRHKVLKWNSGDKWLIL